MSASYEFNPALAAGRPKSEAKSELISALVAGLEVVGVFDATGLLATVEVAAAGWLVSFWLALGAAGALFIALPMMPVLAGAGVEVDAADVGAVVVGVVTELLGAAPAFN